MVTVPPFASMPLTPPITLPPEIVTSQLLEYTPSPFFSVVSTVPPVMEIVPLVPKIAWVLGPPEALIVPLANVNLPLLSTSIG
ncbi:MAG: hypothetical protein ACLSB9_20070 [Hydrogeniiclostridium mannosilyticum]